MAKFEIIESTGEVATSTTPRTSTLALPMSLANTVGSGFTAIGKAIADIQKDIYALEDQNQVHEVLPEVNLKIQKEYDKYLKSIDVNAPQKFLKDISKDKFENILSGKNNTVKKLILDKIEERKALLYPKLSSLITSNNIESLAVNIDAAFDGALTAMLSPDLSAKAYGAGSFKSLIDNKVYESYLGKKTWNDIKEAKTKLGNKILLNSEIDINPKSSIENQKLLVETFGVDEAKRITNKAKSNVISKRARKEEVTRFQLLFEQETHIGAFTEVLLRINNHKINPTDESFLNELPTIQELHEMYDNDMLNEAMFVKLSNFLADPEMEEKTDDEIFASVTEQLLAANTIELLGDIKNTILGEDTLNNIALEDAALFSAYIETAKGDYKKHPDYKTYLSTLKANIANVDRVSSRKTQELKRFIAGKEQSIIKSYTRKVIDGMTPENAYLATLEEQLPISVIPVLDELPFPRKIPSFEKAIGDNPVEFFEKEYNLVLEKYKKSNKSKHDMKAMIEDLDDLDFVKDIFSIRMNLTNGSISKATKSGPGLWSKVKEKKELEVE